MKTTRLLLLFLVGHSAAMQAAALPTIFEPGVQAQQQQQQRKKNWWQRNWGYVVAGVAAAAVIAAGGYAYWHNNEEDFLPGPIARLKADKTETCCSPANDNKIVVGLGGQRSYLSWDVDSVIPAFEPEKGVSHQELFDAAVPGGLGRIVLQKRWYDARQLKHLYERYGADLVVLFGENVNDYQSVTDMAAGQRAKIRGGRGGQAFALGGCNRPNAHGIKTTPRGCMSGDEITKEGGHLDRSLDVVRGLLNEGRTILIPVAKDGSHTIGQALSGLSAANKKIVCGRLEALVNEVRGQDPACVVELNENQQLS